MSKNAENTLQVEWEIDTPNLNESDNLPTEPIQIIKKIPKYNDADCLEDEFLTLCSSKRTVKSAKSKEVEAALQKSIIGDGFEQLSSVPSYNASKRALRRDRKKKRDATKGPEWFNLPIQEVTEEVKNDLDLLRMRSILNPGQFYKKNDLTHTPKYFQVGTVLETPADFYNGRIPKAQRKRSLLNELMADAESRAYQKKKYKMIVDSSRRKPRKTHDGKKSKKDKVKKSAKNAKKQNNE